MKNTIFSLAIVVLFLVSCKGGSSENQAMIPAPPQKVKADPQQVKDKK